MNTAICINPICKGCDVLSPTQRQALKTCCDPLLASKAIAETISKNIHHPLTLIHQQGQTI